MGLPIKDIISRKEFEIEDLNGKMLCVDAFNALYQFLSTIRQPDGTPLMNSRGEITSHLSGIFYRNISLMSGGVKLIYVFDGDAPALKSKTHEKRSGVRDVAREKYKEAQDEGDVDLMRKYSSQLIRLNDKMIEESKELLEAMGISVIQAPSEGEAEASHLTKINKEIYACVSQDYDSLLFGVPKLIRNLTISRKRKTYSGYIEISPEIIELENVLNELGINLDQLICLGILVGTDYNPRGVPGIGQKKALDLVRKFQQPVLIFKEVEEKIMSLNEEDRFDWREIFELFKKPNVEDFELNFKKINFEKIKEILVQRHEFSEERIEKQLDKLRKLEEGKKQKGIKDWF